MRETPKAAKAFDDYYAMGPDRSLPKLHRYYTEEALSSPTKHLRWLKEWSRKHNWQERVKERDAEVSQAQLTELKEKATESGYALYWKRIADLNNLAERLFELSMLPGRVPVTVINQYRGLLSDIAEEMGERSKQLALEHTGTVEHRHTSDSEIVREFAAIVAEGEAESTSGTGS